MNSNRLLHSTTGFGLSVRESKCMHAEKLFFGSFRVHGFNCFFAIIVAWHIGHISGVSTCGIAAPATIQRSTRSPGIGSNSDGYRLRQNIKYGDDEAWRRPLFLVLAVAASV